MKRELSVHSVGNLVYLTLVVAGGVLAVGTSVHQLATTPAALPWLVLAAFTIVGGMATLRLPNIPVSFSISDAFTFTAAVFFGPAAGAVAVAVDGLVISLQLAKRKFRAAATALQRHGAGARDVGGGDVFFWLVGGPVGPSMSSAACSSARSRLHRHLLRPQTGSIAIAIAFDQRNGPFAIWRRHFLPLWLTYFGGAAVAALLFALVSSRVADPVVLGLVVPIPLILYAAFKNAVGRMGDQFEHLGQVNRMYLATIEALATAIDAKDGVRTITSGASRHMRGAGAGARRGR